MKNEDYYRLGVVTKTHGIKGNIIIFLDVDNPSKYKNIKAVFFKKDSLLLSHKVTGTSIKNNLLNLHLEGVDSIESAMQYIKKEVYLPIESLPKLNEKQVYFHEAIGMTIVDKTEGELGKISTVIDLPEQPVAVVQMNNNELLFPFISEFIISVDRINKVINVDLPEGLTDIYR